MDSQDLRRAFMDYFKNKGHTHLPSAPVLPHNDPTLLFNNAGMNQFKDIFLGKQKRTYPRVVTSQKCIRAGGKHNDLDQVGHTSRHLTLFEMLGNFSFGDYFKETAIEFAWECTTQILKIDPKHIWVTVFHEDDEALKLWEKWISSDRICKFDEKENFWSMGDIGPCGPCSELYFDKGPEFGDAKTPYDDPTGERYFEFWNLVFMQYNRSKDGKLEPLPHPSIDTGMGLERLASLKSGVPSVFQTDILDALRRGFAKSIGFNFKDDQSAIPFNVMADHLRALSFAIADGAQPGNTDRGYVLRKMLRRAVRYGRQVGFDAPFLAEGFPILEKMMGEDFPELKINRKRIQEILTCEEKSFFQTLHRGGNLLQEVILKSKGTGGGISGSDAFKLKDTYGFPFEEISLIAHDEGIKVDVEAYEILNKEAKERSRNARGVESQVASSSFYEKEPKSKFKGYDLLCCKSKILSILKDGKKVPSLAEGEEGVLIIDKTPFYAEKGGQVGDQGKIELEGKASFNVSDCQSPFCDIIIHIGKMAEGTISLNDEVIAEVSKNRRFAIERHHSATHLLHYALQKVLGDHIKQAGSVVDDKHLRFDFSHHKSLSHDEIRKIEDIVNYYVQKNVEVNTYELSLAEAQDQSDIKQFFGDKYGDTVRVVAMKDSKELCGGTHVPRLGHIGVFKILREGSIASGVRRIEASVGALAIAAYRDEEDILRSGHDLLKVKPYLFLPRLKEILDEKKALQATIKNLQKAEKKQMLPKLLSKKEEMGSFGAILEEVPFGGKEIRELAKDLIGQMKSGVVVLAFRDQERCQLLVAVSKDLNGQGILASSIVQETSSLIDGKGGGKGDFAQAGGTNPNGIPAALQKAKEYLKSL